MELILKGLKLNLDVSWYAKIEFDYWQMFQILQGLKHGVDVSQYAQSDLSSKEMKQIRIELEEKIQSA